MRFLLAVALLASPALANPKAKTETKAESKTETKPCKTKVVGKGLDRKVVCEFEAPIIVHTDAPKPKVLYVHQGGKSVTGRPKTADPLAGLGPSEGRQR